ncbi:MAG: transcriptional repressor [Alphaproteobacteria bacterium]|nr:transcriptional repressor [Alphaproteobacteria bacterium]
MSSRIDELCKKNHLKMTSQRRLIVRVLSAAQDHPDVEEVHRRASLIDPKISLATVYRTLRLFQDKNILERHDFGNGRSRFEPETPLHHDHLIDNTTGAVIEFHSDEIEKLQKRIAKKMGFRLIGHRLELYGVPLAESDAVQTE